MRHRRDIDGLRALAVMPVLLYHAHVPFLPGGFTGVDIFFVISGFLITGLLMEDLAQGRFSILDFYERRIRRIFPALSVVLAVCFVFAFLLFLPRDFKDFSQSLSATAAFLSNMFFWHESDYFAPASETMPLLHTWSLAVEEQYYILFPPMLWLLARTMPKRMPIVIALSVLPLLGVGIWMTQAEPTLAFYSLPARAWELLAGAAVALLARDWKPGAVGTHILGGLGLSFILAGFVLIDSRYPFPGFWAILPVGGAVMILLAGQGGSAGWVTHMLSLKSVVRIGLVSYSLYLWHWPILVFAQYYTPYPLTPLQTAGALALSFLLAALSWRYIEQPFRNRAFLSRKLIFTLGVGAMAVLFVLGLMGHFTNGLPQRLPPDVVRLSSKAYELEYLALPDRAQCLGSLSNPKAALRKAEQGIFCPLNTAHGAPQVLLWGDSHAEALRPAFKESSIPGTFAGMESCPPLLDVWIAAAPDEACRQYNKAVMDFIEKTPSLKTVILYARWAYYESGQPITVSGDRPVVLRHAQGVKGNADILRISLQETLARLKKRGVVVTLILGTPEIRQDVSDAMARNILFGWNQDLNAVLAPSLVAHRNRNSAADKILHQSAQGYGAKIMDPAPMICDQDTCPVLNRDGMPLYRDDDHLSILGAQLFSRIFKEKVTF
ncbi:MAG: acyltransferase [Alphaproteobacteria bacterium]|nr:acyltransferase [Alphaproteobacteria bacterium]